MLRALLPQFGAIDTGLKGVQYFIDQCVIYPIALVRLLIFRLIAAITSHKRYHPFFAIFFLIYIFAFITIDLCVLN